MLQSKWSSHYSWPGHAVNFRHSRRTSLFCRTSRPGLRSNQPNIQSAAEALSPSDKEAWHADHSVPLSAEFKNTQSLLPFSHKSLRRAQGRFYVTTLLEFGPSVVQILLYTWPKKFPLLKISRCDNA
jgi:hypothetical protein